jgi:hypothetical protein
MNQALYAHINNKRKMKKKKKKMMTLKAAMAKIMSGILRMLSLLKKFLLMEETSFC